MVQQDSPYTQAHVTDRLNVPAGLLAVMGTAFLLGTFSVLVLMATLPGRALSTLRLCYVCMPEGTAPVVDGLVERTLVGLGSLRSPGRCLAVLLVTALVWLLEALTFWLVAYGFGLRECHAGHLLMGANMVFATAMVYLGTVPLAPGGVGAFEVLARETLALGPLASAERSVGGAYALALHAAIMLPVVVVGLVLL